MLLVPGRYEVEVSAPGYVTRREGITHSESPTSHRIALEGALNLLTPVQEATDELEANGYQLTAEELAEIEEEREFFKRQIRSRRRRGKSTQYWERRLRDLD